MTSTWYRTARVLCLVALLAAGTFLPAEAFAQGEAASAYRRYKDREMSTGYYEEYEVIPRATFPRVKLPGARPGIFPYRPSVATVRIRTRLADAHLGIKFYDVLRCEYCHADQAKDIHTVRGKLTCRQCHGAEPIAGIEHYYSPLNPIRRHAYVCAKCHEGSSASFASYVIHPPNPVRMSAMKSFPVLFYVFWFMVALAGGTFLVFLPHTALWGIREFFIKRHGKEDPKEQEKEQETDAREEPK